MAAVSAGGAAHAAKFKVLHSFCQSGPHHPCGDGSNPQAGLVMDSAGNFFGTTTNGGRQFGTAFELERKPNGAFKYKTIFRFCPSGFCGRDPGTLIIDTSGNLYGTANNLVFELSPPSGKKQWTEKALYQFCAQQNCTDGSAPIGGLTYAGATSGAPYDGTSPLYGATSEGGAQNKGAVFQLTNDSGNWVETVPYNFCSQGGSDCTDGNAPTGALVLDASGNLYGTTVQGGGNNSHLGGAGVVFELTPTAGNAWTEAVLYRFCSTHNCGDGARPLAGLATDGSGILYGTTSRGGRRCATQPDGCGTVFKVVPNAGVGQESVLYAFCKKADCKDGSTPLAGLFLDGAGRIFGTTFQGGGNDTDEFGLGGGTVFELDGSSLTVDYRFCAATSCADGEYPNVSVVMDATGRLLGATELGGAFGDSTDGGVVFALRPNGTKP